MILARPRLALALLVPALLSLGLFVTEALGPAVLVARRGDRARGAGRPGDALVGSRRFRAERRAARSPRSASRRRSS